MSLPRYEKYKSSGDEWIAKVPEHWEIWKLNHAFSQIGSGTTPKTDNAANYENGQIPWINTGDLNDGVLLDCDKRITKFAFESHSTLKIYPRGSVVIAMYGATIGKLALLKFDATVNQACCVFMEDQVVQARYLFYWFLGFRKKIVSMATGGGQPNISQDILRRLKIPVPPSLEQLNICAFLDRETAKIDALVAEQQRLIELLKEKRQAVISHAVTKGLNPDAPMKDFGIKWLGEVPAHWEISSLKRYWSVTDCKHITADFVEDGVPLASIREVQSKFLDLTSAKQTTSIFYTQLIEGDRKPLRGDLIFSRNATVGEVAQVAEWHPQFAMGQDVCLLRKNNKLYSSDYLQMLIKSMVVIEQLENLMIGSTFKRVNVDDIRNMLVPMPPTSEQTVIADFLESATSELDALTSEAQYGIKLLQERRTALISAAVTGKIDVRGLVVAQPERKAVAA